MNDGPGSRHALPDDELPRIDPEEFDRLVDMVAEDCARFEVEEGEPD